MGTLQLKKIVVLEMGPSKQNDNFLGNGFNDLDQISVVYVDHIRK
jgi:hypothetical protein